MLDQLKSALETFAFANQQSRDAFEHYQTEASSNLARFQEVHTDVIITIKEDWAKMSDDLTQYTWKSYLNMFGDIKKHYGNLTEYFSRSSDAAIAKQDQALEKADLVNGALTQGVSTVTDLVQQQATYHATASDNNLELLSKQELLVAKAELTHAIMEMMGSSLSTGLVDLGGIVNHTNTLRDAAKDTVPLLAALAPFAQTVQSFKDIAHAALHVNLLTVACVVVNALTFIFVGKKVVATAISSLSDTIRVLVVLRK